MSQAVVEQRQKSRRVKTALDHLKQGYFSRINKAAMADTLARRFAY